MLDERSIAQIYFTQLLPKHFVIPPQMAKSLTRGLLIKAATPPPIPGAKKEAGDIKAPGSRGGKWYRDEKGHVKYGERPTPRFNTALSDEEVKNLETNLQVIASAGSSVRFMKFLGQVKGTRAFTKEDAENLMFLGEIARAQGVTIKDAFAQSIQEANEDQDPEDMLDEEALATEIEEQWNKLTKGWEVLTKKDGFAEAVQEAISYLKDSAGTFAEAHEAGGKLTKNFSKTIEEEPADTSAVKLLAGLLKHGWVMIPRGKKKAAGKFGEQKYEQNEIGRLLPRTGNILGALVDSDNLNTAQLLQLAAVAKQSGDTDEERQTAVGGEASDFMKFNFMGGEYDLTESYRKALGSERGREISDDELAKNLTNAQHTTKQMMSLFEDFNRGNDGGALAQLADEKVTPDDVFKKKDLAESISDKLNEFKKFRTDCLAAQDNQDFKMSDKMSKDMNLFPHQKRYLNWMLTAKKGINAADTGLGKTPMCIAFIDNLIASGKEKRGIISMPPALLAQWPAEIQKFRPGSKTVVLDDKMGYQDRLDMIKAINSGEIHADFVLMSSAVMKQYHPDTLRKALKTPNDPETGEPINLKDLDDDQLDKLSIDTDKLEALHDQDPMMSEISRMKGALMVDEAHTGVSGAKNDGNRGWVALKKHIGAREHGMLMTATPISKTPEDLYNMMRLVQPAAVGDDKKKWMSKIAQHTIDPETGAIEETTYGNLKEMNEDVRPFVYAMRKTDPEVAEHVKLPPKIGNTVSLLFDKEHQEVYDNITKDLVKMVNDPETGQSVEKQKQMLDIIREQRMAAISPELVPSMKEKWGQKRTAKISATLDLVKKHFADPANHGKPCVIFSSYPSAFDILEREMAKEGIHPSQLGKITGAVDVDKRGAIQDACNAGKLAVVMVGIQAGGAGLNLQKAANHMIFLDKPWSPADLSQCVGRVMRTGATAKEITQHDLSMENSYDEQVMDKLHRKITVSDALLYAHRGEDAVQSVTTQSLNNLLKDIEVRHMSPAERDELRGKLKDMGIGENHPVADHLGKEFDINGFVQKRKQQAYFDSTGQRMSDQIKLAKYRKAKKLITKQDFEEQVSQLGQKKAKWGAMTGDLSSFDFPKMKQLPDFKPEKQFTPAKQSPYPPDSDLNAFHALVTKAKVNTMGDFVMHLKETIGEERWNAPAPKGEPSMKEKAQAFAQNVFHALADTGGLSDRQEATGDDMVRQARSPKVAAKPAAPAKKPAAKPAPKKPAPKGKKK